MKDLRPLLFLLLPALALAQPMLADPSQMSGIPRPDPQVPEGTVTVRLIRGELSNRLTGVEVELAELSDKADKADKAEKEKPRTAKTDAEGRATFSGLPPGSYEARATFEDEALASQPIELQGPPGVRVMLVFSKSAAEQQQELGKPDGKARVDLGLPPGMLLLKVLGEDGAPLADATAVVNHGDVQTEKVDALPQRQTGADGTARFAGLKTGREHGYLVTVVQEGSSFRSQPFRLVGNHGSQLALQVHRVSQDTAALSIAQGSHLIFEMQDDNVQVLENLRLKNPLPQAIDPGPRGLRIPLAEGALSPQIVPESPKNLSIDVSRPGEPPQAVWKGPIPPGDADVRVGFVLKHEGTLSFRQAAAVAFGGLTVIVERTAGLEVDAPGWEREEQKFNGRELYLLRTAQPPKAGGSIELTLSGLPYNRPILRQIVAVLAVGIVLAFALALYSRGASSEEDRRQRRERLERERQDLLGKLLQLEKNPAAKRPARDDLLARLEKVYRELDGLGEP